MVKTLVNLLNHAFICPVMVEDSSEYDSLTPMYCVLVIYSGMKNLPNTNR